MHQQLAYFYEKTNGRDVTMYRKGEVPARRQGQVRILCIDNHASSQLRLLSSRAFGLQGDIRELSL